MSNMQKLKKRSLKKIKLWREMIKIDFSCYRWHEQEVCNGGTTIKPDNGFGLWVKI